MTKTRLPQGCEMIHDGFTECYSHRDVSFAYRPLIYRQRLILANEIKALGEDWLLDTVQSCIVSGGCDVRDFGGELLRDVVAKCLGTGRYQSEIEDCRQLRRGVYFESHFPSLAKIQCDTCRSYWFDPTSAGTPEAWTVLDGHRRPVKKDSAVLPLCVISPGECPAGHYEDSHRLTGKHAHSYQHFLECRAVDEFPDDAIVKRNSQVILEAISSA